jgi:hypothetical protein
MNQPQFVITRVAALHPQRLALTFTDGYAAEVDLSGLIAKHPTLARLKNRKVFAKVAVDEWRRGVIFAGDDNLSLASDNLRALALEQAGEYSHQHVIVWMYQNGLTLDDAAKALGISRRMLAYYRSGEKPVPKSIGLAMLGWESLHHRRKAA